MDANAVGTTEFWSGTLNALVAEQTVTGAPTRGRSSEVVTTTEPTDAGGVGANAADGEPVPPAKHDVDSATSNFWWNP